MRVREDFHLLKKVFKLNIAIRRSSLRVAPLLFLGVISCCFVDKRVFILFLRTLLFLLIYVEKNYSSYNERLIFRR